MRFVVTGATGLLGNNLVRLLAGRGDDVRVIVRPGADPRPLAGVAAEPCEAELVPAAAGVARLAELFAGATAVVHCAARVQFGRRGFADFHAANVLGTEAVARACREAGTRMVHVSSVDTLRWGTRTAPGDETPSAEPEVDAPYVVTKRLAEEVVAAERSRGLDAVTVHPAFLLGPWDWKPSSGRMLLEVAKQPLVAAPPGGNDFCHVEDVARGVIAAAERGRAGERYILGGEALSYAEAFALFAEVSGRPRRVLTLPAWLVRAGGRLGDVAGALMVREPDVNSRAAAASVREHHFSSAKAERELGYVNRGARAAAEDAWRWFREHGYA